MWLCVQCAYFSSGKYVYKPTMNKTCCPQYPIRCEMASLRLTKSQKKVIKRVNRYLSYGECQSVPSSEPERHGCEELAAAAADCQVMKDIQLQGAMPRAGSDVAAGHPASQSSKTLSSAGGEKKVTHKTPKPGACFVVFQSCCSISPDIRLKSFCDFFTNSVIECFLRHICQPGNYFVVSRMSKAISGKSDHRTWLHDVIDGVMSDHCFAVELMMLHVAPDSFFCVKLEKYDSYSVASGSMTGIWRALVNGWHH